MILVWGFKARAKAIGTGTFFCPREGGDRTYTHQVSKKWFTVFWIPIFSTSDLGAYIECDSCESTYYPSVLDARTTAEIDDVTTIAIRHVAVSMLKADGAVAEIERAAGVEVVNRFASHPYGEGHLAADLDTLVPAELTDHLQELGSILNEHGKEAVLTAAVFLAASDGHVDASELRVAREIGAALTMSTAHVQGTIDQELARLRKAGPLVIE